MNLLTWTDTTIYAGLDEMTLSVKTVNGSIFEKYGDDIIVEDKPKTKYTPTDCR